MIALTSVTHIKFALTSPLLSLKPQHCYEPRCKNCFLCRKTEFDDVSDYGNFSLVLSTYTAGDRLTTTQEYTVPDRIYARVEFENAANIADTWYIQVTKTPKQR